MAPKHAALRTLAGIAVAGALALGGCDDDEEASPSPEGPLAGALAGIGGGGAGSLGVGWADPQLVQQGGLSPEVMEDSLGPNAGSLIEEAPRLRRHFGLDPLA